MKMLAYKVTGYTAFYNPKTQTEEQQECLVVVSGIPATNENIEKAKNDAYNGEYTIIDDGIEEVLLPTQLDRIVSQVTYTAMMTDTLLEV